MVDIDIQFVCVVFVAIATFQSADADCCYGSVVLQTDETYSDPQECVKITCQNDGTWTTLGCAEFQVNTYEGWTKSPGDPSQSYPDCCPKPIPPTHPVPHPQPIPPTHPVPHPQPIPPAHLPVYPDPLPCVVDGKVVQAGEHYDAPGFCGQTICKGNNEFTQAACASVAIPFGYIVIPEDPSKPYPECCTKAVPPNFI